MDGDARSNRDVVVAGLVGTVLVAGISALLGVILATLDLIDLGGRLPAGLVFAAGAVGLVIGFLLGALVTRWYYKPRLDRATAEAELVPRIRVYASHLAVLLNSLPEQSTDDLVLGALGTARRCIIEATGHDVVFSTWSEQRIGGRPMLAFAVGPDHSEAERNAFRVPIDYSWLAWAPKQNQDEELVSGIPDIRTGRHLGEDLRVIQEAGYGALRCVAVDNGGGALVRLVALGRETHCFTPLEDQYIALLGLILTISHRMAECLEDDDPDEPDVVPARA